MGEGVIISMIIEDSILNKLYSKLYIRSILNKLVIIGRTDYIGYAVDNQSIIEIDKVNIVGWIRSDVWNYIENKFNYTYTRTQYLLKMELNNYLLKELRQVYMCTVMIGTQQSPV
jgi:hypothetical protein